MYRFSDSGMDMSKTCSKESSGIQDFDRSKHYTRTGKRALMSYNQRRQHERLDEAMKEHETLRKL